jgi:soluble lytic murein transglycosylase-like protein
MKINFNSKIATRLTTTLLIGAAAIFATGCASSTKSDPSPFAVNDSATPAKANEEVPKIMPGNTSSVGQTNSESVTTNSEAGASSSGHNEIIYRGMKIQNATFDLPMEMNRAVEKWIDYFSGRGRDRFAQYLERSEYFIPFLKPILKNAKAPEDLVYLAMIESGFNNNARSNARAVGAWQFMSATGRRYGLDVNWWLDERRDVEKSTIAAVQYLKELNAMFGSWYLAAAAYNAGEAKIQRAIKKYHTNDFWELCDKRFRYLRPETKNYVPKLLAAAIISKNRKQFGFEESYTKIKNVNEALVSAKAEEDDDIERLPDQLDADKPAEADAKAGEKNDGKAVANASKDSKDAAASKDDKSATPSEPTVEVTKDSPADPEEEAMLAQDSVESMLRNMSNPVRTPHVNRKGEVNGDVLTEVEVPSPADLFKVSSAAGLTYMEFKSMNPELLRWLTPPNVKSYKIRIPLSRKDQFVKKYFDPTYMRDVDFLTYKARKGDTPKKIAKRFGISADPVADMNSVGSVNSSLMPGKMIQLPIPSDFVRSLASLKSLDLLDPADPKRRHRRSHHRARRSASRDTSSISRKQARSDGTHGKKHLKAAEL